MHIYLRFSILFLMVLLQGCLLNPENKSDSVAQVIEYKASREHLKNDYAKELGAADIGDIVKNINDDAQVVIEYTVISEYHAASGVLCRNIKRQHVYSKQEESALLCQDESLQWHWPRQLVFE